MKYPLWCRRLRQYRERTGLTQQEVATQLGLSRPQYCAIEHGRTMISYKHLENLAKVFKITMADLMVLDSKTKND